MTYPAIQRKVKSNKLKAQQLPKHLKNAKALSIFQQKEEEKRRKEIIKEGCKETKKNFKDNFKKYEEVDKNNKRNSCIIKNYAKKIQPATQEIKSCIRK